MLKNLMTNFSGQKKNFAYAEVYAVINVQAILASTHWRCPGKIGFLKGVCSEIKKN